MRALSWMALSLVVGCGGPEPARDAGHDAASSPDAARHDDAGRDAAMSSDAGRDGGNDAGQDAGNDAGNDAGQDAGPPPCVGPPGLYREGSCTELAEGVRPFHPRYALWSDGYDKERFVYLPPGTQIDTSDPDRWGFPVGTRLYKTFSTGGTRIETRLLEKVAAPRGAPSWRFVAYLWSDDQLSVSEVGAFGETDVFGTDHDIPTRSECIRCHSVTQDDTADGFSAVQLAHDEGGVTLQTLLDEGWLSAPIDPAAATIPGDATAQAALGYLHANCGNCHGGPAPEHNLDYWIRLGTPDVISTRTWATAVCGCSVWTRTLPSGSLADLRIAPHHPETSVSIVRMQTRVAMDMMPPMGSNAIDPVGIGIVSDWIASLDETANGCPHTCPWP
ncbi:MAG: hypothetical protein K1X94_23215 [Sandaracinaceae bacterium]|nr:hypothetical protein [Sandaracinaceae bacterium]